MGPLKVNDWFKGVGYCSLFSPYRTSLWGEMDSLLFFLNVPCLVAGVERVDIGLPYHRPNRTSEVKQRKQVMKANKKNVELERALRLRTCKASHTRRKKKMETHCKVIHFSISSLSPSVKIPLGRVQDAWAKSGGPVQIQRLADHYGVFRDLFPMAYFLPQVPLHVCYSQENAAHVYHGNRLTPTEVRLRNRSLLCFHYYLAIILVLHSLYFFYLGSGCPPGQLRCRGGVPVDPATHLSRSAPSHH